MDFAPRRIPPAAHAQCGRGVADIEFGVEQHAHTSPRQRRIGKRKQPDHEIAQIEAVGGLLRLGGKRIEHRRVAGLRGNEQHRIDHSRIDRLAVANPREGEPARLGGELRILGCDKANERAARPGRRAYP